MSQNRSLALVALPLAVGLALAPLPSSASAQPAAPAAAATTAEATTAEATTAEATSDFYRAPSPLPAGRPGEVIRSRAVTLDLGVGTPSHRAWTVMYHSRDTHGADIAVTGTVVRPTAAWTGPGARPVVGFAAGTQGPAQRCAPSKQLVAGSEYEDSNIAALLRKGWAVAITDYEGYTTGKTATYVTARSEGHAVLDSVRAAQRLTGSSVTGRSPLTLWGYSQGGGASAWATVLHPSYAPELRLKGTASGGVPADSKAVGDFLNGSHGAAFLLYSLVGYAAAYPGSFPLAANLDAEGRAAVELVKTQCVTDSLPTFAGKDMSDYLDDGETIQEFSARRGPAGVLSANTLTTKALLPQVPVYQYHGAADEIVPLPQARTLHTTWCAKGVRTGMQLFPGEHLTTNAQAASTAIGFLADRYAGRPYAASCAV